MGVVGKQRALPPRRLSRQGGALCGHESGGL